MAANLSVKVRKDIGNGRSVNIGFTKYGNKHLYSDTFRRSKTFQRGDLLNLPELISRADYVKSSLITKERPNDKIKEFHYFKVMIHGNYVYLNVGEEKYSNNKTKRLYLYSVTDTIK